MAEEYTPTTEAVRSSYGEQVMEDTYLTWDQGVEAFDRWLAARDAARDAEVQRKAAEEALTRYRDALSNNEHAESWFKDDFISDIGEWADHEYRQKAGERGPR